MADGSPVDRHYVVDPDSLFDKAMDDLVIDTENNVILEAHLQCASHEVPLTLDDEKYFGPLTKDVCEMKLSKDKDGWSVSLYSFFQKNLLSSLQVPPPY